MPVVINEFEVVDTPQAAPRADQQGGTQTPAQALPDPEDLRRMLAELAEQQLRCWSH
jgi:hypothetical protein